MHFQSVCINVIWCAVLLEVLVAPSIQRVGFPVDGVTIESHIIPRGVVASFRTFGHHIQTQEITEIHRHTVLMV